MPRAIRPSREHAARCRYLAGVLIDPMRRRAAELGYALAEHGSKERDIDLVGCPWTFSAVDMDEFVAAMVEVVRRVNGYAQIRDRLIVGAGAYDFHARCPEPKPHGRVGWSIELGGGVYVDLSVMPRANDPFERYNRDLSVNVDHYTERTSQ